MVRWIIFLAIIIILEIYAYQSIRATTHNRWIHLAYFTISLFILLNFLIRFLPRDAFSVVVGAKAYALGMLLALLTAQIILVFFLFAEDIVRFLIGLFSKKTYTDKSLYLPSRRRFISKLALGIAAIPFSSLMFGMIRGKYNYKVLEYELEFEDLPEAFDGYQITQISDLHCGSFDNKEKVAYGIRLLRDQESDLILFTGDLVNSLAEETEEWTELLSTISAPDGVYSVLGNHDYGMYYKWASEAARINNFERLQKVQKDLGWDLLLNEHRRIERNGQFIHILGVENWGDGHFPKLGDIDKAAEGLNRDDFKIVLSHDPSHWDKVLHKHEKNFQLTMSGHTHGMQFGIEIPGVVKWSPVQYRYKYWAGVYKKAGRYINVNRGFGFLAYPGRVGMWPEITVIKLKKASSLK